MKKITIHLLFISFFFSPNKTFSQTLPSNLPCGEQTRTWIKQNYFDNKTRSNTSYDEGRRYMYAYVDNPNNLVTCVYGGYQHSYTPSPTPTNPVQSAAPSGWLTSLQTNGTLMINAEHTIPQSFFSSNAPMVGDIHHLFPTYHQWNSDRSNYRFADIPDNLTTKWERNLTSQTTIPTTNIDEYSERGTINGEVFYEPREDHKGRVARAVLYFYTVYPTQAGSITSVAELSTLQRWHEQQQPNAADIARNTRVEAAQGNRNPYIDNPSWIYQAWCLTATLPVEFVRINAFSKGKNNLITWQVEEKDINVYIVERSADGITWNDAVTLKSTQHQGLTNYEWIDNQPFHHTFYRVKAVEAIGKMSFSRIVSAQQDKTEPIHNIKTFVQHQVLTTELTAATDKEATIEIFDMMGQKKIFEKYHILIGENRLFTAINDLNEGIYIVRLKIGEEQFVQKIFKL